MKGKLPQNDQCNLVKVTISQFVYMLIITFITIFVKHFSNYANMVQNEAQVF